MLLEAYLCLQLSTNNRFVDSVVLVRTASVALHPPLFLSLMVFSLFPPSKGPFEGLTE